MQEGSSLDVSQTAKRKPLVGTGRQPERRALRLPLRRHSHRAPRTNPDAGADPGHPVQPQGDTARDVPRRDALPTVRPSGVSLPGAKPERMQPSEDMQRVRGVLPSIRCGRRAVRPGRPKFLITPIFHDSFRFFPVFPGTFGRVPWIPGVQTVKMGERWGKMGKEWVKNGITGVHLCRLSRKNNAA